MKDTVVDRTDRKIPEVDPRGRVPTNTLHATAGVRRIQETLGNQVVAEVPGCHGYSPGCHGDGAVDFYSGNVSESLAEDLGYKFKVSETARWFVDMFLKAQYPIVCSDLKSMVTHSSLVFVEYSIFVSMLSDVYTIIEPSTFIY